MMRFTSLLVLTLLTLQLSAQVRLGVRGGILSNAFNYEGDALIDSLSEYYKNRSGVVAGLVLEARSGDKFAIQTGIDYAERGHDFNLTTSFLGIDATTITEVQINYLEIPVLLKLGMPIGPLRIDLMAGPSFGYGLSGTSFTRSSIGSTVLLEDKVALFEDETEYERFNLMGQAGAMITLNLGRTSIFVDGRYHHGFTDIQNTGSNDELTITSRGTGLSAGLMFKL
jgi:hypothetical protein